MEKIINNNYVDEKEQFFKRIKCKSLCFEYNNLSPDMLTARYQLVKKILGKTGLMYLIEQPFMCDYGNNISIGENFFANHNMLILDVDKVTFGNNVLVGPNCSFYTPLHSINPLDRKNATIVSKPIVIKDNVWIGGNVTVLAGVTIGENTVIGAGSLVSKNIPPNSVAYGNPCKVVRFI